MMLLGLSQAAPPEQPLAASSTVALSPEEELQEAVRKYQRRQLSSAIVSFHELATRPDIQSVIGGKWCLSYTPRVANVFAQLATKPSDHRSPNVINQNLLISTECGG